MLDPMDQAWIGFCTAQDETSARELAQALLAARLVACVNLLPQVQSMFWWQGQVESAAETLMIMKTTRDRVDELKQFITEHHGYDTPELLLLPVSDGLERYLSWVQKETRR